MQLLLFGSVFVAKYAYLYIYKHAKKLETCYKILSFSFSFSFSTHRSDPLSIGPLWSDVCNFYLSHLRRMTETFISVIWEEVSRLRFPLVMPNTPLNAIT